jgi:predicted HicB family RNase H-like nuclease
LKALNNRSKEQRFNNKTKKMIGNEKQTISLNVRMTKQDAAELKAKALKEKISVSALVRRLTIKEN